MKLTRRKKNEQRKRAVGTITLYRQRIPHAVFSRLSETERYCLLVLGHIHDELSWLQRMAFVATRSRVGPHPVEAGAYMMQSTMFARMFFGKLFEFHELLAPAQSLIRSFIGEFFDPVRPDRGEQQVEKILEFFSNASWVRLARNKHFMHYPKLSDVLATIQDPNILWDIDIYHGAKTANTFYPTSDVLANYAWLRLVRPENPMGGMERALDLLTEISRLTMSSLEQSIGYFIDCRLLPLENNEEVRLLAPFIRDVQLPYFVRT